MLSVPPRHSLQIMELSGWAPSWGPQTGPALTPQAHPSVSSQTPNSERDGEIKARMGRGLVRDHMATWAWPPASSTVRRMKRLLGWVTWGSGPFQSQVNIQREGNWSF